MQMAYDTDYSYTSCKCILDDLILIILRFLYFFWP